jgi:predicted transposase/invertase (TIGR01784 family)
MVLLHLRADALILLNSDDFIFHIEVQTEPNPAMGFRMADYRLRGFRRFPNKQMHQVVIYLTIANCILRLGL